MKQQFVIGVDVGTTGVRDVGGCVGNETWTARRQRKPGVAFAPAQSGQAAAGTARLALMALGRRST